MSRHVQAVVVFITEDDVARLGTRYLISDDPQHERELTPQARPNVLFEAGLAFGRNLERTILVALGNTRPFSDVAGRHIIYISDDIAKRQTLADRLRDAGCTVELTGRTDWHHEGDFNVATQSPDETIPKGSQTSNLVAPLQRAPFSAQRRHEAETQLVTLTMDEREIIRQTCIHGGRLESQLRTYLLTRSLKAKG
jgi:CAP12/Pycsar effector protein, TIR domain